MDTRAYDPIKTMAQVTREVIVAFSGGKDSCVTLDLCTRFFDKVYAFFMYQVPNLSFQERTIQHYEKRYGIEVLRIPHFETSVFFTLRNIPNGRHERARVERDRRLRLAQAAHGDLLDRCGRKIG